MWVFAGPGTFPSQANPWQTLKIEPAPASLCFLLFLTTCRHLGQEKTGEGNSAESEAGGHATPSGRNKTRPPSG